MLYYRRVVNNEAKSKAFKKELATIKDTSKTKEMEKAVGSSPEAVLEWKFAQIAENLSNNGVSPGAARGQSAGNKKTKRRAPARNRRR